MTPRGEPDRVGAGVRDGPNDGEVCQDPGPGADRHRRAVALLGRGRGSSTTDSGDRTAHDCSLTRIAHRGYPLDAPENTVAAVSRAARDDRADAVEVDVRRCADDLVVIHDGTVDRTTDGSGPVAGFTAAELDRLSVDGSEEGVPRFADVLAAVPADVALQVELKERAVVADALAAIRDADCPVVVSSFDAATVRACREEAPEVPRSLICDRRPAAALATARRLDCTAIHPPVEFVVDDRGLRAELRQARTIDDLGRLGVEWARRRGRDGLAATGFDAVGPPVNEALQRGLDRLDRGADVDRVDSTGNGPAPEDCSREAGADGSEKRPRTDAASGPGRLAAEPHLTGEALVARAHALDVAVNAWTVTRSATVAALARTGADGVAADTDRVFDGVARDS